MASASDMSSARISPTRGRLPECPPKDTVQPFFFPHKPYIPDEILSAAEGAAGNADLHLGGQIFPRQHVFQLYAETEGIADAEFAHFGARTCLDIMQAKLEGFSCIHVEVFIYSQDVFFLQANKDDSLT